MQNVILEVDLRTIRENASHFTNLCAVVKANAYGHGGIEVSHALYDMANSYAVSLIDEGIALRLSGIDKDIIVFTPPVDRYDVERATSYDLILTVPDFERAILCEGKRVHLAVNVGMNRYGFDREENLPPMQVEGVYSHLTDALPYEVQYEKFRSFRWYPSAKRHLASTHSYQKYPFDMVRIGLGLYGYGTRGVKPAMKAYAINMQSRKYEVGGFGYFPPKETDYVSTLRVGYGDGFFRGDRLCMDAFVTEGKYEIGEKVLIMDDAEKEAKKYNTIPYEITTSLGKRGIYVYQN